MNPGGHRPAPSLPDRRSTLTWAAGLAAGAAVPMAADAALFRKPLNLSLEASGVGNPVGIGGIAGDLTGDGISDATFATTYRSSVVSSLAQLCYPDNCSTFRVIA